MVPEQLQSPQPLSFPAMLPMEEGSISGVKSLDRPGAPGGRLLVVLRSAIVLAGCMSGESPGGGDCTSSYQRVAEARSLSAHKTRLAHDVDPQARSVRVVGQHDAKTTINVLNRRNRIVMQVDVWQKPNGRWIAARWLQCID